MKKRILALVLCCALAIGLMPVTRSTAFDGGTDEAVIYSGGTPVSTVSLPMDEKLTLTAVSQTGTAGCQWQIQVSDEVWASISGASEPTLEVSYALVANLLRGGEAKLRCKVTNPAGNTVTTEPVTVVLTESRQAAPAYAPVYPAGTVLSEAQAVGEPWVLPAAEPQEGEGEPALPEIYSILIQYVFADGSAAANPWTANVGAGQSFRQTVLSPEVVGYAPDQISVEIDLESISQNRTYTVTYYPAEVQFTVDHLQQNIENDLYTLAESDAKSGFTGSPVGTGLARSYDGFVGLLYDETTAIAADGSTRVEIRYDRLYFLLTFDLDGGYGAEPIYARYGAPIAVDTASIKKAGHTFTGWEGGAVLPATMPAQNLTLRAVWDSTDTAKVTIVIWGENADDERYSYIKSSEIDAAPGTKITFGSSQMICGKQAHQHSAACGYACGKTVHAQHTTGCYAGVGEKGNAGLLAPGDPAQGQVYHRGWNGQNYIYIGSSWYRYTGSTESGSIAPTTCGLELHTHSASCGYLCGLEEHVHTNDCYLNESIMDTKLWQYKESEEITVAADGSSVMNVYFDRTEFTLHFRRSRSNSDNYGTIQGKWGMNIRTQFNAKSTSAGTSLWSESRSGDGPWTSILEVMPTEDRIYYANSSGGQKQTATYYGEKLDGTGWDTLYTSSAIYNGQLRVTEEEFIEFPGFTLNTRSSAKVGDTFDGAKFYYTRGSYELSYYNYNATLDTRYTLKFEQPLAGYNLEPPYPDGLEPNAYYFDGWYSDAFFHNRVDFTADTMPASDLLLYAKWTPKTHTVETYLTKDLVGTTDRLGLWEQVPHGSVITPRPEDPVNGRYTFVAWFYEENGVEKAFDFSMPIVKDLRLYAKWTSNTLMAYTVRYAVQNADGSLTCIAPDTTGSALAGTTRTFEAKTGTELNEGYQTGYFPLTSSHSMLIDIEATPENRLNEYTFLYAAKAEVGYRVRYLDRATGEPVEGTPDKVAVTRDNVITESFLPVPGYRPDAYQKRLVLSADETENVIIFWYEKDTVHAPVQINHWTQNAAGSGYTLWQESTNLDGVIGQTYTEGALDIPGFRYEPAPASPLPGHPALASAELTESGLELNLYYDRIEYPYEFRFLERDTERELAAPVTGTARYQEQVTQNAKTIPGYTLVSAQQQAIRIAIEDPADTAGRNVCIFYYTENEVRIDYRVAGPEGCGSVAPGYEVVKAVTGQAQGSEPAAADGFRFVGWFLDADCTQPVDESWLTGAHLTPQKTASLGQNEQGETVTGYENAVYYAKFEYALTTLTITKAGAQAIDENQSFLFDVKNADGTLLTTVVITGSGSATVTGLPIGSSYTVTERTSWSWRYTPQDGADRQITLSADQTQNTVNFTNDRTNGSWLNGCAVRVNSWAAGTLAKLTAAVWDAVTGVFG